MRRSHRAPVWQVANEVYLQCVPEKQENLLRARTLMRGSSLARFLALCEGCDIEWKGDGSNTLQMFVEDREHMKEVRYAHRLLTHLVLSAHTCQHPYHSTHHIPRPPTALLTFAGSLSRSVPPPGQGGGVDEPTNHWRASPFVGSRLPARSYAPGTRDIVVLYQTKECGLTRGTTKH